MLKRVAHLLVWFLPALMLLLYAGHAGSAEYRHPAYKGKTWHMFEAVYNLDAVAPGGGVRPVGWSKIPRVYYNRAECERRATFIMRADDSEIMECREDKR
jgi:hypothetical protein